jgi:hypothetical protein
MPANTTGSLRRIILSDKSIAKNATAGAVIGLSGILSQNFTARSATTGPFF